MGATIHPEAIILTKACKAGISMMVIMMARMGIGA